MVPKCVFYRGFANLYLTLELISGNFYPERSVFHIFVALCAGPRFVLVLLWFLISCERRSRISRFLIVLGIVRTLLFGIWAYVSSTEDIVLHEITGLGYLICTLPWTITIISIAPQVPRAQRLRKVIAACIYTLWVPIIIFYIQHKRDTPGGMPFELNTNRY
jgi:Frag1/DRAM/Sfk1 family